MSSRSHWLTKRLVLGFVILGILLGLPAPILTTYGVARTQQRTIAWDKVIAETTDSEDVESQLLRGIAFANLGRLPEAFKEFEIAGQETHTDEVADFVLDKVRDLRRTPDDLLLLNCAAFGSYAFGDFTQSTGYFEDVIRLDPNNVWARNFCAIVYGQAGQLDKAQNHLKGALSLDPKNQYTHLLMSAVYKEKNQYLMAVYHYLQAPEAIKELQKYGIL